MVLPMRELSEASLTSVEEMLDMTFGDVEENIIDFRVLHALLLVLARSMSLLERKVYVSRSGIDNRLYSYSSMSIHEVRVKGKGKTKKKSKSRKTFEDYDDDEDDTDSSPTQGRQRVGKGVGPGAGPGAGHEVDVGPGGRQQVAGSPQGREGPHGTAERPKTKGKKGGKGQQDETATEKLLILEYSPDGRPIAPGSADRPPMSIATKDDYQRVVQQVMALEQRYGRIDTPESEALHNMFQDSVLSDPVAAVQLSARLEYTERAIIEMAGLLSQLAGKPPQAFHQGGKTVGGQKSAGGKHAAGGQPGGQYAVSGQPGGGQYAPGGGQPGGGQYAPGGGQPGGGQYAAGGQQGGQYAAGGQPGGGQYAAGGQQGGQYAAGGQQGGQYAAGGQPGGGQYAAGGQPGGQYAAGGQPGGQYGAGGQPGGQYAAGGQQGGQFTAGGQPGGQYAAGGQPGGQYAAGGQPGGQYAPGGQPGGQYAAGGHPGGQYAPGGQPGGQYAPGGQPGGQYAPGGQPGGQYAPGGQPGGQYAPDGQPGGQYAPGGHPGEGQYAPGGYPGGGQYGPGAQPGGQPGADQGGQYASWGQPPGGSEYASGGPPGGQYAGWGQPGGQYAGWGQPGGQYAGWGQPGGQYAGWGQPPGEGQYPSGEQPASTVKVTSSKKLKKDDAVSVSSKGGKSVSSKSKKGPKEPVVDSSINVVLSEDDWPESGSSSEELLVEDEEKKKGYVFHDVLRLHVSKLRTELPRMCVAPSRRIEANAKDIIVKAGEIETKLKKVDRLPDRMIELEDTCKNYATVISGLDETYSSVVTEYQEELTEMQQALETAIDDMNEALANREPDLEGIAEVHQRFNALQVDLDNTELIQMDLDEQETDLDIELQKIFEELDDIQICKSTRAEVEGALWSKASMADVNGKMARFQCDAACGELERNISLAYDKFNSQENFWQKCLEDMTRSCNEKCNAFQVDALKIDADTNIKLLDLRVDFMITVVGERRVSDDSKQVARYEKCVSCGMEPYTPIPPVKKVKKVLDISSSMSFDSDSRMAVRKPRPPKPALKKKTEEPVDGAGDGICYPTAPVPHPVHPRARTCGRYCGGRYYRPDHHKGDDKKVSEAVKIKALKKEVMLPEEIIVDEPCYPCNYKPPPPRRRRPRRRPMKDLGDMAKAKSEIVEAEALGEAPPEEEGSGSSESLDAFIKYSMYWKQFGRNDDDVLEEEELDDENASSETLSQ